MIVNGQRPALTAAQQELIGIFADYLRRLPKYEKWEDRDGVINNMLTAHFRARNPLWKPGDSGTLCIADLQTSEQNRFRFLLTHAGCLDGREESPDERSGRAVRAMREALLTHVRLYNDLRMESGLPAEHLLNIPVTPLEIAAQASFEENHQEN